jgi:dephospho-CoA kinase
MKGSIITVGLTGGIGSGKTTAADIFEKCGATVIYADLVARDLIDSNKILREEIIKIFGPGSYFPDGRLDRVGMAKRIFKDRTLQRTLNAIVHPAVINEINRLIKNIRSGKRSKVVIVEAALIFEAGIEDIFDYIVVVDAGRDTRVKRMMLRDGKSTSDIRARIASQIPNNVKTACADFVIKNDGTLRDLENSTRFLYRLFVQST